MKDDGRKRFVVCVCNERYPASLELLKVYEQLSDPRAEGHGLFRVADEDGEALYPAGYFIPIHLTKDQEEAIESAAAPSPRGASTEVARRPVKRKRQRRRPKWRRPLSKREQRFIET